MSTAFIVMLAGFFGLAALGMPVAYAMFVTAITYLFATGADVGEHHGRLVEDSKPRYFDSNRGKSGNAFAQIFFSGAGIDKQWAGRKNSNVRLRHTTCNQLLP